ncbi:site-2 protease family protein [Actinoplanes sp. NPDC020271]|uniref:site-2 protease family protein n=1 Tax=Actinoplanes sp. NPDC020271 TaxID=3363896 RepID=UPI0037919B5B
MRQTVRLGRVRGIPIGVHWSVLVILLMLVWTLAETLLPDAAAGYPALAYWLTAIWMAVLFLAALTAHELAHALVAQHYGISVQSITLWALGGVSVLDDKPRSPRAELLIAGVGPLTSLVAAGLFGVLTFPAGLLSSSLLRIGLTWLAGANLMLAVFNLLPGAPLDGGRILTAIVWWIRGDQTVARRAATQTGAVLGVLLSGLGALLVLGHAVITGVWLVLLGWYLGFAARGEQAAVRLSEDLRGIPVSAAMSAPAVSGQAGQSVAEFAEHTARWCPHRTYPVIDLDGRLAGLLPVAALASLPASDRRYARLARVMIPVARLRVVHPEDPLLEVVDGLDTTLHTLVVVDRDRPCGVLTAGDVGRLIGVIRLGAAPAERDLHALP